MRHQLGAREQAHGMGQARGQPVRALRQAGKPLVQVAAAQLARLVANDAPEFKTVVLEATFPAHGDIAAFNEIGGIPARHVRYDNLTAAVTRVVNARGRERVENDRWVLFRSHFGFDAFYCQPGIAGAHEKGGVEGEIGRFRRRHLVPVPTVASLAELNEVIAAADEAGIAMVFTGMRHFRH